MTRTSRRAVVASGLALLGAAACRAPGGGANELRVVSWEGYTDDRIVRSFQDATGARVRLTYVSSVDELSAKMTAGGGANFDVLAIESSSFRRMVRQRLMQPLDLARLPAMSGLLPAFRNLRGLEIEGIRYGAPYAWGSIPLIYAKAAFPTPPDSWSVLWASRHQGRVIALDDANQNIVTVAIALGLPDPFNLTDGQFELIKRQLLAIKRNVSTYYAGFDEGASIFAQGGVDLMLAMAEPQVEMIRRKGGDVGLTIPKEGAIGWVDCWAISAGCRNLELAHAWIEAMLQPSAAALLSNQYHYGNVRDAAANAALGLTYAERLTFLDAPEDFARRVKLWNEVKATPV